VDPREQQEREVRAARNQALFRAVNEQVKTVNEAFASITGTFAIACECADTGCIETLQISPDEYSEVRSNPRHFAVLSGHIYPDVEQVVRTSGQYVVVEKMAKAAEMAELLDERTDERTEA
jgi:hypothetical protein